MTAKDELASVSRALDISNKSSALCHKALDSRKAYEKLCFDILREYKTFFYEILKTNRAALEEYFNRAYRDSDYLVKIEGYFIFLEESDCDNDVEKMQSMILTIHQLFLINYFLEAEKVQEKSND